MTSCNVLYVNVILVEVNSNKQVAAMAEETRTVIKFCVGAAMTPTETMKFIHKGKWKVARSIVFKWHKRFADGLTDITDQQRPGRPRRTENDVEQAMAYHYMSLRESRNHVDSDDFHNSSLKVFRHYYSLVCQTESTVARKEELTRNILYQVLYHWEVEGLPVTSLEECLDKILEGAAVLLAAVIFRTESPNTDTTNTSCRPTMLTPSPKFLSRLSAKFCLRLTTTVLQQLQGDAHKLAPGGFSLLEQLGGEQLGGLSPALLSGDKLPYDQLWQDVVQNLQKGLETKKYIYVTHNELDRLEDQLNSSDHSSVSSSHQGQRTPAVFFTCGHYYTRFSFISEVEKFEREARAGPAGLKLPETVATVTEYYRRTGRKPLACPRCVFTAIAAM